MTCRYQLTDDNRRIPVVVHWHPKELLAKQHPATCPGCLPCDDRHCIVCAGHLRLDEIGTCIDCLGQARRDLFDILDLVKMLPDHALRAARWGHLVASDPIPGGDAIVMLSRGSEGLSDDGTTNPGDPMPPSYVLAWWESRWRDALGLTGWHPPLAWSLLARPSWQRRADRTLITAYAFLTANLGWAAAHHGGFHVFARDIAGLRRHLEQLLYAGDYPAEGVACFDCNATLVREYRPPARCRHRTDAALSGVTFAEWVRILDSYPELADRHADCDQGGLKDPDGNTGWHCPRCRRDYSAGEYQLAVKATYSEYADVLPATELAERLGVQPATIWQWAQRGHIRRRGRGSDRRTLYDVHDALRYVSQIDSD